MKVKDDIMENYLKNEYVAKKEIERKWVKQQIGRNLTYM